MIEHQGGMCAGTDLSRDFLEMPLHGLRVATGQDERRAGAALGADGAEDICGFGSLVMRCPGAGSPLRPAPRDLVLLADPRLILPPQFYLGAGCELGPYLCQLVREFFLKASIANSFWAWCRGRAETFLNPMAFNARPTVVSSMDRPNSSYIHCARSLSRQRTTS
jgi:hypothetical protein